MGNFAAFVAVATRLIFACHSLVAIWRVTQIRPEGDYWWLLASSLGLLLLETLIIVAKKKGEEWKGYCPSFLFYLMSVVPAIWFIELDKIERIRTNTTTTNESTEWSMQFGIGIPDEVTFSLNFTAGEWALYIEQSLLVVLILGRWLLPKGELTRDELSHLLLVYLGLASDIIDFFGIIGFFIDKNKLPDMEFILSILAAWSWSLLQFTFVLTGRRKRMPKMATVTPATSLSHCSSSKTGLPNENRQMDTFIESLDGDGISNISTGTVSKEDVRTEISGSPSAGSSSRNGTDDITDDNGGGNEVVCLYRCCESEITGILVIVFMQDLPFFVIRVVAIAYYGLSSYTMLFFVCKNAIVLCLQVYRLIALRTENAAD
ncbi:transmembrane protein 26-like [Lingula anatina]|uniref:Transmembrane protein 26-like n=1 Tax=Lingula anatina TaxID=7574 RepID=A0A1S3I500_LINAN|nr:transmembrane protein 26-like [Lingula anatina]|eukprot:XP_013393298.1 transmembrane protein 26-like [Lingula anatina]